MGADEFMVSGRGKTLSEAFTSAVDNAKWEHGHGGYTGTIAEKHGVKLLPPPPAGIEPLAAARFLLYDGEWKGDPPEALVAWAKPYQKFVDDKWGPALAVQLKAPTSTDLGTWIFLGVASS